MTAQQLRNVLEACKQTGAKLVYISSSQANFTVLNQYATSKIDDERAAAASGVPHVILRPAAPFGPKLPDHAPSRGQTMHELVHLHEHNHSPAFYERLARTVPDFQEKEAWLERNGDRYAL